MSRKDLSLSHLSSWTQVTPVGFHYDLGLQVFVTLLLPFSLEGPKLKYIVSWSSIAAGTLLMSLLLPSLY